VLVATNNFNVLRTADGGETWQEVLNGGSNGFIEQLQRINDQTVYAFGKDFHRSTDGGLSWETIDLSEAIPEGMFLKPQMEGKAGHSSAIRRFLLSTPCIFSMSSTA